MDLCLDESLSPQRKQAQDKSSLPVSLLVSIAPRFYFVFGARSLLKYSFSYTHLHCVGLMNNSQNMSQFQASTEERNRYPSCLP